MGERQSGFPPYLYDAQAYDGERRPFRAPDGIMSDIGIFRQQSRAARSFPLSCKTGRGLGCGWHLGNPGILERDDLPLVLFLYRDQRWAGVDFARLVAFLELYMRSGKYHRDIGAQKADAP